MSRLRGKKNLYHLIFATLFFFTSQSAIKACSHCQHIMNSDETSDIGRDSETAAQTEDQKVTEQGVEEKDEDPTLEEQRRREQEKELLRAQIGELEKELVQTKLQMVEATCKIQVRPVNQTGLDHS